MLQTQPYQPTKLPRGEAIAQLNDTLRQRGEGGTIMVTRNVLHLPGFDPAALQTALAEYQGFCVDSDPHGERDFGDLTLFGASLLWKVDYFASYSNFQFGSDDPADPSITKRVLTVMLAEEW